MSPEQASGRSTDPRSDIFSFGVVLYELLAGRRPFGGATDLEVLQTIIHGSAPPLGADVPVALRMIVEKAIEKGPAERYQSMRDLVVDLRRLTRQTGEITGPETPRPRSTKRWTVIVPAAAAVLAMIVAGYWYLHRTQKLTEKDTLVLADFVNNTGDPVFDGTLRQGLSVQLEQSPFLSLVSEQRIQKTLALMGQPADARLTPDLAQQICERIASAAVLDGSIASLGSQYVLGLRAKNCRTGDVLDEEQVQAARKEDVLNALSQIATKFRTRVGESLATVEKHDTPLAEATTSSLDALKSYSAALKVLHSGHSADAVALFKHATEIDPKFAIAHAYLGRAYADIGESSLSAESTSRAYQLRDRASDSEKFFITASYDLQVTGNLEKAQATFELWGQTYPREYEPPGLLSGGIYPVFGKFERAIEQARRAIALDPDVPFGYVNLAGAYQFLERLPEAEAVFQSASERKTELPELQGQRYQLAVLRGDKVEIDRQVALTKGNPGAEDSMTSQEAIVQAYSGHLQQARRTSAHAVDLAQQAGQRETAAMYLAGAAVREALFGNSPEARRSAMATLELSKSRDAEYGAALALAFSGDFPASQTLANDLEKRYPEDTSVRTSYTPVLHALFALNRGEPSKALEALQIAVPNELGVPQSWFDGSFGALYPVYLRGQAYLAAHQGVEAAAEFQKILDHPGIVFRDPIGALARLYLGRSLALSGDKNKARTAYQEFFGLWKDADPGIPILKEAKAEYAKVL